MVCLWGESCARNIVLKGIFLSFINVEKAFD